MPLHSHEAGDDAVEARALVAVASGGQAQLPEVLSGLHRSTGVAVRVTCEGCL